MPFTFFLIVVWCVPLGLAMRAWRVYYKLDRTSVKDLLLTRPGLALISVATAMWVAIWMLIVLTDYSSRARSVAEDISPLPLSLLNFCLSMGAIVCTLIGRNKDLETADLRRAITASGVCLALFWLLLPIFLH
jgi:hypothetical protein